MHSGALWNTTVEEIADVRMDEEQQAIIDVVPGSSTRRFARSSMTSNTTECRRTRFFANVRRLWTERDGEGELRAPAERKSRVRTRREAGVGPSGAVDLYDRAVSREPGLLTSLGVSSGWPRDDQQTGYAGAMERWALI